MGVAALLFNRQGELLIVKTSYKNYWSIPGGVVDIDESPRVACIREIKEEVGIDVDHLRFISMDYCGKHDDKDESLQMMFDGGELSPEQIAGIKLAEEEINTHQFVSIGRAQELLGPRQSKWLPLCLDAIKNNTFAYLEDMVLL